MALEQNGLREVFLIKKCPASYLITRYYLKLNLALVTFVLLCYSLSCDGSTFPKTSPELDLALQNSVNCRRR